jgi:tetratricopeptide (TPR) repeat protein
LDGLPLAIELIAAQMRLMSPQALLERLTNTFILSAGELRTMSARQKTLGNAIGWSYRQLTPQEQKVFAWLAVFNNGFTLKTVEAVLADTVVEKPISNLIASLADKSLLQSEFDAYGEIRFSMLVVIKMFALDCLRRAGDEACARNHHLAYFLELAEQGAREMRGPNQVEWINRLENELDNIRAALEWSLSSHRTEAALRLLGALGWPWEVRSHYREARNWLEKIRSLPDFERFPASYARLLNHIGRHSWTQGNFRDGRALLEESRAIALKLETQGEQILAETLNWLGAVALFFEKDIDKAASLFQDGLTLSQKWSDPGGVALSTFHLGIVESDRNHPETALFLLEQSLAKFQQLGDMFFVSRAAAFIGSLYLRQGRYDQARLFFEMHLKIDQEMQFWDGISDGFLDLGNLYRHKGEYDQASYLFEQSLAVCTEHGLYPYNAYYASAMLALVCSNYELAHERFMQLLRLTCHSEEKDGLDVALIGLAAAAVGMKQPERAARLDGAARAIFEITYLSRMELEAYDAHILIAREQLGNDAYAALQAEGRAMSMEQIIQYALGNSKGNPVLNELKSF